MDDDPGQLLIYLAFALLLFLSAFFSASEVAFLSLSPAKTRTLTEEHPGRAAKLVVALKSAPQRFLTTILIGNNLVNVLTASLATVVATRLFGSAGLGIATGAVTIALLIFGEIVPKGVAQRHAVGFALLAAYPIYLLTRLLLPVTWLFEKAFHLVGLGKPMKTMTEEELLAMVEIGHEEGEIKSHERELIENVLEFTDTRVHEVMTPRVKIDALERRTTVREAAKYFTEHTHSRMPVYELDIDHIIGIVTLRDILEHMAEPDRALGTLDILRPIVTPTTRPIRSLFQEFKSRHIHLAIAIDEHGGTAGLVTLEDILEELVGEIHDEEDIPEEAIRQLNPYTVLAPGQAPLSEIDDVLETRLAAGEFEDKSIAYLILEKLGRFPKVGERLRAGEAELTVEEVIQNRIAKVKVEAI